MDSKEQEFLKKLKETFQIEAKEHLQIISNGLLEIEKNPINIDKELINTIFREAHSLKGAARAVNHSVIQNLCQSLETVLSSLRQEKIKLAASSFDILYSTIDLIDKYLTFDEDINDINERKLIDHLIQSLEEIAKEGIFKNEESEKKISKEQIDLKKNDNDEISASKETLKIDPQITRESSIEHPKKTSSSQLDSSTSTIRVSTSKLDLLLQEIEEMLVIKLTSGQRVFEVKEIQKDFEKWHLEKKRIQKEVQLLRQWLSKQNDQKSNTISTSTIKTIFDFLSWQESQMKDFKEKINSLKKKTEQDYRVNSTIIDNLLEETKKVLMQPFATILEPFPRMLRDIGKTLGKEVELEINGADIEIDRRILEEMKDPLMHLLRNSIDHGIEFTKERISKNKSAKGTISIDISQVSGSNVEISVSDDGSGIDIDKIKQSAIKNNFIQPKESEALSDSEALMLIFQSGVSTSNIITDLSGRGVGMGVVSQKVEKLGGQIFVESTLGKGTKIKIHLPITLATFRGIHVIAEEQGFIIPTHYMLRVLRIQAKEIKTIEGKETILNDGKNITFVRLSDILGLEKVNNPKINEDYIYILLLKASEVMVAVEVDKIISEEEVFIKGLGKQLTRVRNIAAATVMEWGKIIPILDPFDFVKSVMKGTDIAIVPKKIKKEKKDVKKIILIAEDTLTARMLLKNILDSAGYIVKTAVDGAEAYSIMLQEKIDLLLSDIEMPRLNGFDLTLKVRENEMLKDIPIVLCTSLSTKEDKEKGILVGANAYIIKSSFEQSNLLETIQRLL